MNKAVSLMEKRDAFVKLASTVGGRVAKDPGLKAMKALMSTLKDTTDTTTSRDHYRQVSKSLATVCKECEVIITDAKALVITGEQQVLDSLVAECSDGLDAAQFPSDEATSCLPWDGFLKAVQSTWAGYVGGDALNAKRVDLKQALATLSSSSEAFGVTVIVKKATDAKDIIEKVDALLFSVKAIKGLELHSASPAKLRRYAKAQLSKVDGDNATIENSLVPKALLKKLEESKNV